jgi:hypothetical protein
MRRMTLFCYFNLKIFNLFFLSQVIILHLIFRETVPLNLSCRVERADFCASYEEIARNDNNRIKEKA